MFNKTSLGIVMVAVALGLAVSFWFLKSSTPPVKSEQLMPVRVEKVERVALANTLEAIGTAKAFESVTITANVTEYVKKLHFEDGDAVKKGDLLVELARAEEVAQLNDAQARLKEANQQFTRVKNLVKRNFSARSEYDAQQANVESLNAQIERIKSTIADRIIRAPFDGVLGFRQISDGTLVEPGNEIVVLSMIQPLRLDFTVPEQYAGKLYKNMPFKASSIAYPKVRHEGKVETISPQVNEQTRSIQLRGRIQNKDLKLKPGMLMQVTIKITSQQALKVPEEALLALDKDRFVFIVSKGDIALKKKVSIIRRSGANVFITGEISPEDRVITEGAFRLRSGQKVKVIHASK